MTDAEREQLRELIELAGKATGGKWWYDSYNTLWSGSAQKNDLKIIFQIPDHPTDDDWTPEQIEKKSAWYRESVANIEFVVAAHELVVLAAKLALEGDVEVIRLRDDNAAREREAFRRGAEEMLERLWQASACAKCHGQKGTCSVTGRPWVSCDCGACKSGTSTVVSCPACAHLYGLPEMEG